MKSLKRHFTYLFLFFLFLLPVYSSGNQRSITAYFTPAPAPVTDISQNIRPSSQPSISAYEAVVQALNSAEKSIYLAAYEFNIYHLSQVLLDKLKNGVKVFILVEADSLKLKETHFLLERLHKGGQGGAVIIPDQKKGGIMHNKFIVIDEKILVTGSANFSVNAFFQQYNDVVVIEHSGLAKEYLKRFLGLTEKIYRRRLPNPSLNPPIHVDQLNPNVRYQAVFSRSTFDPTKIMVNAISTCKKSIHFLIFAYSSRPITEAMKGCIKKVNKGKVMGIFDNAFESENITKNWGTIPFQILWDAGADVKYDNVKEKIHHKNLIIDGHTIITGSFNFSANAQKNNDENYLIIRSPDIATQYRERFQALWQEFPSETLFETYIRARNRKQTTLNFNEYEKKFFNRRSSAVKKELKNKEFNGRVVLVEDGNTVIIKLAKTGERIRVTLAGIMAPIFGSHEHNQHPQAHLAKEGLIFLVGQRVVTGKVLAGSGFDIHALLYDKEGSLINAAMIEAGLAYPLWSTSPTSGETQPSLTYEKNSMWTKEIPQLEKSLHKAQKEKLMLWGNLKLPTHPLEFKTQLEEAELQRRLTENQYSSGEFTKKSWIGNRKTGKAYPPGSPTYMEYLRDLNDKKLIFFASPKDAESAGYLLRNERNY